MAAANSRQRCVVVGAGTAGVNGLRSLRQLGWEGELLLVSAEAPYSRMTLPYHLAGEISESRTCTLTDDELEQWGVKLQRGRVQALDASNGRLLLESQESLAYDQLLLATGSRAVRPPVAGMEDNPRIHDFWTLTDSCALKAQLHPNARVVLLGGGFIAFTILNALLKQSGSLTIIERQARILPRMVDEATAVLVQSQLEQYGVKLQLGASLTAVEQQQDALLLQLEDGQQLTADVLINAAGILPNLEWLKDSGLQLKEGVCVQQQLRASLPNIYAAGDIAQGPDLLGGPPVVHAIEPTAAEHGRIAAANIAGREVSYAGSLAINIVGAAGLDVASFGHWDAPADEVITASSPQRGAIRKYLLREGRLLGAVFASSHQQTWKDNELGMLKGLVQSQVELTPWLDALRDDPFHLKPIYLASGALQTLLKKTTLGTASPSPRR